MLEPPPPLENQKGDTGRKRNLGKSKSGYERFVILNLGGQGMIGMDGTYGLKGWNGDRVREKVNAKVDTWLI